MSNRGSQNWDAGVPAAPAPSSGFDSSNSATNVPVNIAHESAHSSQVVYPPVNTNTNASTNSPANDSAPAHTVTPPNSSSSDAPTSVQVLDTGAISVGPSTSHSPTANNPSSGSSGSLPPGSYLGDKPGAPGSYVDSTNSGTSSHSGSNNSSSGRGGSVDNSTQTPSSSNQSGNDNGASNSGNQSGKNDPGLPGSYIDSTNSSSGMSNATSNGSANVGGHTGNTQTNNTQNNNTQNSNTQTNNSGSVIGGDVNSGAGPTGNVGNSGNVGNAGNVGNSGNVGNVGNSGHSGNIGNGTNVGGQSGDASGVGNNNSSSNNSNNNTNNHSGNSNSGNANGNGNGNSTGNNSGSANNGGSTNSSDPGLPNNGNISNSGNPSNSGHQSNTGDTNSGNGQHQGNQSGNSQTSNSQTGNGGGQTSNDQTSNSQAGNGHSNGQGSNGQGSNGQTSNGQSNSDSNTNGTVSNSGNINNSGTGNNTSTSNNTGNSGHGSVISNTGGNDTSSTNNANTTINSSGGSNSNATASSTNNSSNHVVSSGRDNVTPSNTVDTSTTLPAVPSAIPVATAAAASAGTQAVNPVASTESHAHSESKHQHGNGKQQQGHGRGHDGHGLVAHDGKGHTGHSAKNDNRLDTDALPGIRQNHEAMPGKISGWLDQATANLGGHGVFDVTPPRNDAAKQQHTESTSTPVPASSAGPQADVAASQMASFDPAPFDSAARTMPQDTNNNSVSDSSSMISNSGQWQDGVRSDNQTAQNNSNTPAQPNSWQEIVGQAIEASSAALANSDSIVKHIEEESRIIKALDDDRNRREDSRKHVERQETEAKDRREKEHKRLEEDKERLDKHEKERKEKRLADEMMTMLALRQESEAISRARADRARAEREMMQDIVRKENHQEKYSVKQPEDLSNIARKKFMNPSIAQLIYELNPNKVDVKWVNGQPVYIARAGVTLVLPSQKQVKEWLHKKGNVGKNNKNANQPQGMAGRQQSQTDDRRANIEKILGKIKDATDTRSYAVRLGDTLRSVAMKHPEMRDVSLWKLLADKNGLPTDVDSKGAPLAILIRGTSIVIPTAEEIEEYRVANNGHRRPEPILVATSKYEEMVKVATKLCNGCKRLLSSNSNLCPACGFVFAAPEEPTVTSQATTFNLPDAPTTFSLADQNKTMVADVQAVTTHVDLASSTGVGSGGKVEKSAEALRAAATIEEAGRLITALSDTCRLIKTEKDVNGKVAFYQQLEVLSESEWMPVLSYEVGQENSVRHEYSRDGRKKTIKIDLPAGAVGEMVENELSSNWQDYCNRYLAGRKLSA